MEPQRLSNLVHDYIECGPVVGGVSILETERAVYWYIRQGDAIACARFPKNGSTGYLRLELYKTGEGGKRHTVSIDAEEALRDYINATEKIGFPV